jgi:glycosyltransferase involved in cell wall biosynthesis
MRIGFIWQCVYPWDVRLEKLLDACVEGGHSVCLVSKGRRDLAKEETVRNADVVRVMPESQRLQGLAAKLYTYPLFFNPTWRSEVLKTFKKNNVDLIIVRDLPLGMLATWVGEKLKVPVIMDMAENYPAALMAYQNPVYKPFLFGNAWLPKKYEMQVVRKLAHVFVVAEEQRQRLIKAGADSAKLTLIGNTPVDSFIRSTASSNGHHVNGRAAKPNAIDLLYVGKIDVHRGVDLMIRALPGLQQEFPELRLTLVGDGKSAAGLAQLAKDLGVADKVNFPGWVDWTGISGFIRKSTVCLIPHRRSEHTDTTLPNKLFDYMALSKPVIASDCEPLRRIIAQENCGLVFKSGDVESLQNSVRTMLRDPELDQKGSNGRRAIEQRYNWTLDKTKLLDTIRRFGESGRA